MSTRLVRSLVTALAIVGSACTSNNAPFSGSGGAVQGTGGASGSGGSQDNPMGSGGTTAPGTSAAGATGGSTAAGSGGVGTGGRVGSGGTQGSSSSTGGSTSTASGGSRALGGSTGSGSGGTQGSSSSTGGSASTASGGSRALGGSTGSGTGGTASSVDGGGGSRTGADAVPSDGCGKARTLQNGTITIQSRKYILRVPDSYDNKHSYRLLFAFAELGSSAQSVADRNYFTMATYDNKNTIFVAPDAANGAGSWSGTDLDLTDAILAQIEGDLCIDKTRIFATGFSFGGAMSIAIACTRADVFRAVAFFSGADLTGSCLAPLTKPIAYYASQASHDADGMDPTASMTGETKQAQFAAVNGCTPEPSSTVFPAADQPHTCTIYKNCTAGHPTEYCVFNGGHGWEPTDPGQTTSWDAPEAWKFITQF